jgi:hypothetical protein
MTDTDLISLRGLWTGGDAALREEAWNKARAVEPGDPREKILDQCRDRLATWVNDTGITWAGAYNRSVVVPSGVDQGNLRMNAVPPILDAIVATLFDDVLDEDERNELLEPLRGVTEPDPADRAEPAAPTEPGDDRG